MNLGAAPAAAGLRTRRRFESAVRDAVAGAGMGGTRLLAAVSGGPDSLALLLSLHTLRAELGVELVGAHLDHGLRGEESAADAGFVESVFKSLGMGYHSERADVHQIRSGAGLSQEEAAREVRYEFLARSLAACGAGAVALGHTSDDQAETVLMNIIRGSGLTGLRGMRPLSTIRRNGADLTLFRPLLGLARADTLAYCEAMGLKPRIDRSNLSTEHSRNRVRLELLPALESYNPAVREALIRLSSSASRDLAYIEEQAAGGGAVAIGEQGRAVLCRRTFAEQPEAIKHHLIRRAYLLAKGRLDDLESYHVTEMVRLMDGGAGKRLDLPGRLRFTVGYDHGTIACAEQPETVTALDDFELEVPGTTGSGEWTATARLLDRGEAAAPHGSGKLTACLDAIELGGPLRVRARAPGERFQPLGMPGMKKLQDFMVDAKVPREVRNVTPLLVSPRGIAWVVGWRIAHWARVREDTQRVLALSFRREVR